MNPNSIDLSLQDDTRAVSSLIGFILLFGILVIAFVGYQAQVVPQQNAETEFEHFQENRNELIDLRSAILTAGTSDRPQFPTVQLGTNYQTRILALNGPPPAGLLQTSDSYPIIISDETEETDDVIVQTRFLEYQPGYYEIDVGSTWYENSVLYTDEPMSGGERVVVEDQNLVTNGDTLRITALQNDFQRSGTDRVTLELYPTSVEGNISELAEDEELTINLPTRLSSDYWEGQFENNSSVTYEGFNDSENGIDYLILSVDSINDLELNTVGIREEPTEDPAETEDVNSELVESESPTPFGVFTQAENEFSQNGNVDATFNVNDGNTEYDFDISVSRAGSSSNYNGDVTIDGRELTMTDDAAAAFGTGNELDLLDRDTYDGLNQDDEQLLDDISNDINGEDWSVDNIEDGDGNTGLGSVEIREQ